MSRRPGIAGEWFKRFYKDVFPSDEVVVRDKSCKPPRFYDNAFELLEPGQMEKVRQARMDSRQLSELKLSRVAVKATVRNSRLSLSSGRHLE